MTAATDLHDVDAERAVLGAMLMSPDVAEQVTDIIDPSDHYQPAHAAIHAALVAAINQGAPTDPIAIATRLAQNGDLERAGGAPYLHQLITTVDIAASAPWHARNLADLSIRRQIAAAAIRIHQRAGNLETETAAVIASAQNDLHLATMARNQAETIAFGDGLDALIEEICDPAGPDRGLSTSIGALDDVIGGLKPGQLVIVGGRPGAGKSVLAVDMVRSTSIRQGLPSLVISLEMSKTEVRKRVCAAECSINLSRILNGGLTDSERLRLRSESQRLGASPIYIDENSSVDMASIRTAARRIQQRHGLSLLVVDYLQLMTTTTSSDNRAQEVAAISRGLKVLARELGIPVVAAAQLNRNSEHRTDRRPQLSDLRESGSIEADADIVILLHRPDYHDPEDQRAGEIDLIVCKNRNGPQETVTAAAQLEYARIVDMLPEYR